MQLNKSTRVILAITTGVLTLATCVLLFMGAFFVNDTLEPALERPGSYSIKKQLRVERNYDKQDVLYSKLEKIKRRELNVFQKTFLGLLQASVILLSILVIPLGIALVLKIVPSKELFYRGIQSRGRFSINKTTLMQGENPGIYKFHRTDDEYFSFSKPKMRRKLLRTFIIWLIISTVTFISLYNPDTVEILGLPVAAVLITLIIFLRVVLPAPRLIFDRLRGEVTFKGNIVNPGFTAKFDKISPSLMYGELMAIAHPVFSYGILAFGEFNADVWSFYVQYMDKNRPLPDGNVFDEYRERDFQRRKAEGYKTPAYPSAMYICDANSGYINATPDYKEHIKTFKLKIEDAHAKVLSHLEKEAGGLLAEPYKLCFLGLYEDQMVFKYMEQPTYDDLQVFKSEQGLSGCLLIHKKNYTIKKIEG